uniref:MICOS complex subunit n=1 Tax=Sinocyclocheilus anshuiensis TaxID=1608454 RepID=A0A671T114_9TELE
MSYLGKIAKVAVPGALGLMSGTVFAARSFHSDTPEPQLRYKEPEVGHVEQAAASLRKTVEPYISWCQVCCCTDSSYYKTVEPGVNTTQSIVKDMYVFLNDPPSEFFPSVGVIGFSGILGLYLAKGSRIKRLMFPTGLMVLSTSMFYPQHAASVARTTKHYIFSWGSEGRVVLEELLRGKSSSKDKVEKTQKTASQKSS